MKMLAYRFVIRADGWKELCAGLHVDPDFLLAGLPGYEGVRRMEEVARPLAFTAEEAMAYLRRTTDVDDPPVEGAAALPRVYHISTGADVAREMREYLAEKLDEWR